MTRLRPWRGVLAAAAALFAVNASAADMAPLDPPQKVRFAYVPIMKFAAAYVAEQRGLFDKYGLDVDFERVKSGTEAIAFLTQGSVDVGGIAIVTSLWSGWNRGLDLKIIAPGALEPKTNATTGLYVRKALKDDGTVSSVGDLKGRRISSAGGPGSGGEYLVSKALERGGLTIRDVELVNIANPDAPQSMAGGAIDGALVGHPYGDTMVANGDAVLLEGDLTPGLMTVAYVASGKFVSERAEVAERFVLALTEAARMMQGEDYLAADNLDAYLTYTNSTEEALRAAPSLVYDPDMAIPVDGLADVERVHRENGRTEYDEPLDISKVVDERFVDGATKHLSQ